jgi:alpha-glucosidase
MLPPGDPPPDSRAKAVGWGFPALFNVPDARTWALLTESGTDESYCACHLEPDSAGGLYRIAFPLANETTRGWTNKFDPQPRSTLPWTMPWRVIVLGESAGDIAMSQSRDRLGAPPRAFATHHGSSPDVSPGPGGPTQKGRIRQSCSITSRILPRKWGWEYTLFDAGWWTAGLTNISRYAQSKGVRPLAWLVASDFLRSRETEEET